MTAPGVTPQESIQRSIEPVAPAPSRWAQMTYSSFERPSSAGGGWQVKQTAGELSNNEVDVMRSGVSTRFEAATAIPQFPSRNEIAAFPRRLVFRPGPAGTGIYWHTTPAGLDGAGRPGNVFAHVLLDRRATEHAIRPIELWRSPSWLTPFGQSEVLGATLTDHGQPPPGPLHRRAVLDFLFDPEHWRLGVLGILLDAVAQASRGGPAVVLGASSPDQGALWIAAISQLTSPGCSGTISFSTLERGDPDGMRDRPGVMVSVIDFSGLDAFTQADDFVVIDERQDPDLGDLHGEPHATQSGVRVPVTAWSAIAGVVLADREVAERALRNLDDIASLVGDHDLDLVWPLAMAVCRMQNELADAVGEATAVIAGASPFSLERSAADLEAAARLVMGGLRPGTADAWAALDTDKAGVPSLMSTLVLRLYLRRALNDGEWLSQPGGVPLPGWINSSALRTDPELARDVRLRVSSLAGQGQGQVGRVLGVVDLCLRAGLTRSDDVRPARPDGSEDLPSADQLRVLLGNVVVPQIVSSAAEELIERMELFGDAAVCKMLRDEVFRNKELGKRPIGDRLSVPVLRWLLTEIPQPPRLPSTPDPRFEVAPAIAEFASVALTGEFDLDEAARAPWWTIAVWAVLADAAGGGRGDVVEHAQHEYLEQLWDGIRDGIRAGVFGDGTRLLGDLASIAGFQPNSVRSDVAITALQQYRWSHSMHKLTNLLKPPGSPWPAEPINAVHLVLADLRRRLAADNPFLFGPPDPGFPADHGSAAEAAPSAAMVLDLLDVVARWDMSVNAEIGPGALAAWVVAAAGVGGAPRRISATLRDYLIDLASEADEERAVQLLDKCADLALISDEKMLAVALLGLPEVRRLVVHVDWTDLASLDVGAEQVPLLAEVLHTRIASGRLREVDWLLADSVKILLGSVPRRAQLRSARAEIDRVGWAWLRELSGSDKAGSHKLPRFRKH